ncbi:hypothetical protein [Streptomyces atratus]|uniref:hypothetical protein n=1 Tax=Streptomyces atratus TaxID=1893 RepID=UPI001E2AC4DD|nr:hypothetical protein [Streptomyces atratus]
MLSVVNADGSTETGSLIDEIVREGARRMLAAALEAEVNQYIAPLGRTLIDRRLYLPVSWTDDLERCRRAGVDDAVGFACVESGSWPRDDLGSWRVEI